MVEDRLCLKVCEARHHGFRGLLVTGLGAKRWASLYTVAVLGKS